jgi:hypothetical protein
VDGKYRIKHPSEVHERIAKESELTVAEQSARR